MTGGAPRHWSWGSTLEAGRKELLDELTALENRELQLNKMLGHVKYHVLKGPMFGDLIRIQERKIAALRDYQEAIGRAREEHKELLLTQAKEEGLEIPHGALAVWSES
jgi:hypothetical protein